MTTPIEKVRAQCLARGTHGIRQIGIVFRNMDNDGSKNLARDEVKYGLQDYGVKLTPQEFDLLLDEFDKNKDGKISFDEFLRELRGPMNEARVALVKAAFAKLDTNSSGNVSVDEIKSKYVANKHPKVLKGESTEDQVFKEFMGTFESAQSKDGNITMDEFLDYFAGISSSIDQDVYFEMMMKNCWKL